MLVLLSNRTPVLLGPSPLAGRQSYPPNDSPPSLMRTLVLSCWCLGFHSLSPGVWQQSSALVTLAAASSCTPLLRYILRGAIYITAFKCNGASTLLLLKEAELIHYSTLQQSSRVADSKCLLMLIVQLNQQDKVPT